MSALNAGPFGLILLGLVLGVRHAADADHVIAITTIVSRERRIGVATRIGLAWGAGHAVTVLAVGAAIIIFKVAIPPRLGLALEFAVAVVLILLGISTVGSAFGARLAGVRFGRRPEGALAHWHPHEHGGARHSHPHVHFDGGTAERQDHRHLPAPGPALFASGPRPWLKAFYVGLAHGLAGSAALALLVLGAIPDPVRAILYLAVFCVGTLAGMAATTTAIGAPFALAAARSARFYPALTMFAGLLSFAFGLVLAYRIGVGGRLFGPRPIWKPS